MKLTLKAASVAVSLFGSVAVRKVLLRFGFTYIYLRLNKNEPLQVLLQSASIIHRSSVKVLVFPFVLLREC